MKIYNYKSVLTKSDVTLYATWEKIPNGMRYKGVTQR